MDRLRAILRQDHNDDGLSIVEVVVAMFIFALIATGSLYTMISVLQTTRDSRSQQVAANLAAQDIDLARDYDDLFKLLPVTTYTVPLNGDVYTVRRETEWVGGNGNDVKCGDGGAALSYKRINVSVTWDRMKSSTPPVRSDTIVDPKNRITDPTKGTILVFVKNDRGSGSAGVTVTANASSNPNGAVRPSPNTVVTDAAGCAYILRVARGNYDITVSHTSGAWVDEKQAVTATKNIGVEPNATASVGFQFDKAAKLTVKYASSVPGTTSLADNMETSFSSPYGVFQTTSRAEQMLHPFASGYQVTAGNSDTCLATVPSLWTPAAETQFEPADPGEPRDAEVSTGVVKITKINGSGNARFIRAVAVDSSANGNPGCVAQTELKFGKILPKNAGSVQIALPFGEWIVYAEESSGAGTLIDGKVVTSVSVASNTSATGSSVIVDPRVGS